MAGLLGYPVDATLHEGAQAVVFRGRDSSGRSVILKAAKEQPPSVRALAQLEKELRILRRLREAGISGVPEPVTLATNGQQAALVLVDSGGVALDVYLTQRRLRVREVLTLGAELAGILAGVHAAGVLHKDVKPANVLVDPDGLRAWLLDFGLSAPLRREHASARGVVEGSLPYMAPEQTGRLDRPVDERSDLYALGVTLYELLTGRRPFEADDPVALVHEHLAARPTPAREVDPAVPRAVSALVARLLEKDPAARYQTARGLAFDLRRCLDALDAGRPDDVVLGTADHPDRLVVPDRLYGREAELTLLLRSFERARQGPQELVTISGPAGIGKSSVVRALLQQVVPRGGRVVVGKADLLARSVPLAPVTAALRELVSLLFLDGEAALRQNASALRTALGPNVGLLVERVPALASILEDVPDVAPLRADAARTRLEDSLVEFVAALARIDAPLVLFLDDLQWADEATLSFVVRLCTDPSVRHLLVACAWRDDEVAANDPLARTLGEVAARRAQVPGLSPGTGVVLQPIGPEELVRLVRDSTARDADVAEELAAVLRARTQGSPLFARQFLEGLHADGLMWRDAEGGWTWDIEAIARRDATDNVVSFLARRVEALAPGALGVLRAASRIGTRFELATLSRVTGLPRRDVVRALWPALEEGLVLPLDESYALLGGDGVTGTSLDEATSLDGVDASFRFLHDRVRQAVDASIPTSARAGLELAVAEALHEAAMRSGGPELVKAADHYVHAAEGGLLPANRRAAALLLGAAADTARESAAFATALRLYEAASQVGEAPDASFERRIALQRATCTYLVGRVDDAIAQFERVLAAEEEPLARAEVASSLVVLHTNVGRYAQAIDVGVRALAWCGHPIPRRASQARMIASLVGMTWRMRGRTPESILDLPVATDPAARLALTLLNHLTAPTRYEDPIGLTTVVVCAMCAISLAHGNAPTSAFAWGQYGFLAGPLFGNGAVGLRYSAVAGTLVERFDDATVRPLVQFVRGALLDPWGRHPRQAVVHCLDGMHRAALVGNPTFHVNCAAVLVSLRLLESAPLSVIEAEASAGLAYARQHEVRHIDQSLLAYRQLARALAGRTVSGFDDAEFSSSAFESANADSPFPIVISAYRVLRTLHALLLDDVVDALGWGARSEETIAAGVGVPYSQLHPLVHGLALARAAARATGARRRAALRTAGRHLRTLQRWARTNPEAMSHRVALLEGALHAARGARPRAVDVLERAARLASEGGFSLEAGLAHEEVARAYRAGGHDVPALAHLRVARQAWTRWGATASVLRLERAHPELVLAAESPRSPMDTISGGVATVSGDVELLDLRSVFKITQAISSEIVFERLLARMLELSCEAAGARRGVIVLSERGVLHVAAEHRLDRADEERTKVASIPLAEFPSLATSVVLLASRARQTVLIADTRHAGAFASDPWIARRGARSVLAVPVVHQGHARGVLYLEHDETPGVFSEDRTQLLSLLSGQIANAIENSLLYRDAERMAQSFSRFVPTEFLQHLGRRSILDVELGDAVQREMTVLFADIRDFTARTEGLSPSEAFRFVNAYLRRVGPVVRKHGGFIDKYIGDAVMALFPRGPEDAVQAAVDLQRAVDALNREELAGQAPVRVGVGVHVGPLVLGTIGEERRIDSTVIADAVNVASRLETMTKAFGAGALVTGDVHRKLPPSDRDLAVRWLGAFRFRGKARPLDVYELLDALDPGVRDRRLATRDVLERAVRAGAAGDPVELEARLAEVEALDPTDPAPAALRAALTGNAGRPRS